MFEDITGNKDGHYISNERIENLIDMLIDDWCTLDEGASDCVHVDDDLRHEKYCRKCWRDYIAS